MPDMRTALQGGYADAYKDMIDPRYASMTHTGQEPVGMDTVRAFQAMPGQIADWARNNPLDAGALAVSPVPIAGDIAGFANDMRHMVQNPEERTWGNAALAGAGLIPFVPPMAGMVRGVKGVGKMTDALTDLPMDEASRMARADEMFPIDAYHGTAGEDFSAFRNQAGKPSLPVDGATWFSKQPSPASYIAQSRMESAGQDAGRIIPARLRMDNPLIVDAQGKHAVDVKGIKDAASRGYDGVILNNVREFGSDELTTSYGIFDPKNIRSRFAAFDPARKESANILAGIAGGAVVTPAMIEAFLSENEGQY